MGYRFRVKHKNKETAMLLANEAAANHKKVTSYTPAQKRGKSQKDGFWHVSSKGHKHCGSYDDDCIWTSRGIRKCNSYVGIPIAKLISDQTEKEEYKDAISEDYSDEIKEYAIFE